MPDLLEILQEANQDVPAWFERFMRTSSRVNRGTGGFRGKKSENRYGGSDYRRTEKSSSRKNTDNYYSSSSIKSSSNSSWVDSPDNWEVPFASGYGGNYGNYGGNYSSSRSR